MNFYLYVAIMAVVTYLIRMIPDDSFTVLDFFSGSGTTAQAVFELNREDGGGKEVAFLSKYQISVP